MGIGRGAASVFAAAVIIASVTACAQGDPAVTLPPEDAAPDYQLGEAYPPEPQVGIVVRDRTAAPAEGLYSICYVNGFQTQPGELDAWPGELLLKDADDNTVFDPDWPDEALLDTSTEAHRAAIVEIVEPWIRECADAGYLGVEFDNLDTYARSDGALTFEHNAALATALVDVAHDAGLAAGQKNAAEDAAALRAASGFDFAVTEECAQFDECDAYEDVYGDHVIAVEYDEATFRAACEDERMPDAAVLRDRDLTAPGDPAYVFALCRDD